jgi:hypothetical protein
MRAKGFSIVFGSRKYSGNRFTTDFFDIIQEGARAYEVFDKKMDNCIKAVLLTS